MSWRLWLGLISLCAVVMTLDSLDWPIANHAPMRLYVAREILAGAVPYRDIVDLHTPGTDLLHMMAVLAFGIGDFSYRVFDLVYLLATDLAAMEIVSAAGWPAALLAALLITIVHLANGPKAVGDADFLLVLPLMISSACFLSAMGTRKLLPLLLCGLAAGFAITIKTSTAAFPLLLLPVLVWIVRRDSRLFSSALAFLAGVVAAPLAVLAWLAQMDALAAYVIAVRELTPLYDGIERLSLAWEVIRLARDSLPVLLPFLPIVVLCVLALIFARARIFTLPALIACVGIASGLVIVAIYPRDLEYGLYTLIDFAIVLAALCCGALLSAGPRGSRAAGLGLLFIAITTVPMAVHRFRAEEAGWPKNEVSASIVSDLERLVPADSQVQIMDDMLAGIDAVLRLSKTQPTSFPYDYPLFMRVGSPYTTQFRTRFLAEITHTPPAAIVVTDIPWWNYEALTPGYSRLATWPELEALLARDYELKVERKDFPYLRKTGYRIYVRR